ncbi:MAG: C25 family peptidase propeptide domain-containing protein, partial [Candidatus Cloacimonetes bacterium]|nr:C25 family peptidase propeptide domain-containing protein [Candidatus Cloacimonadota bacterium]
MRYTILTRNHIKLYAFLCIVLSMPMAVHAGIFSLEQENQNVLTVKFQLPEYSIQNVDVNGTKWQKIVSDDGSVYGQEGFPELRNYSTAIAVPVDGDFSFSIENSDSNVTQNINLIPSSKLTLDGDEPGYLSAPGFVAYGNRELYPLHICEKGESAFVGNRKFIPLTIYPF